MVSKQNPIGRSQDIVTQRLEEEVMIYDLKTNKALCLNETSSLIWEMCDGSISVSEITKRLEEKVDSPIDENLVWLAIDQFKKNKLIINSEDLENRFHGMNRRDVIKKIGLGTMVALPIISTMIAPTAISAQSAACLPTSTAGCGGSNNRGTNCTCSNNNNCTSGNCVANAACTGFSGATGMSCAA